MPESLFLINLQVYFLIILFMKTNNINLGGGHILAGFGWWWMVVSGGG